MELSKSWLPEKLRSTKVSFWLFSCQSLFVKVTVQFETEGNDQSEIVHHMDGSEVKL